MGRKDERSGKKSETFCRKKGISNQLRGTAILEEDHACLGEKEVCSEEQQDVVVAGCFVIVRYDNEG